MAKNINYYNSEEYKEKLAEVEDKVDELKEEQAEIAIEKAKKIKKEKRNLNKIFNEDRVGSENMHFVKALIDRASFLRVELDYIEQKLRDEGCMDFFVQGTQTLWREHPLSKVHVQYTKNYKDVITKLESYGKTETSSADAVQNPLVGLIGEGNKARNKYKK